MGKSNDQIKIAKINAWQAILVALIGALAGVTGTTGLRYFDNTKTLSALSEKEKEIATLENKVAGYELKLAALPEKEKEIANLRSQVARSEPNVAERPVAVLRMARIGIDRRECLKRLYDWHRAEVRDRRGNKFSEQSTSYDQYFISQFERFTVRVACPTDGDTVAISVSLSGPLDPALAIADKLFAALQ
jgi:hypothetical protein